MKEEKIIKFDNFISSSSVGTFYDSTSAVSDNNGQFYYVSTPMQGSQNIDKGKYSIFEIANWFLNKQPMTNKKLQKMCYYAQAWYYALKNLRLIDSDFQAWVHGPVSPALYAKFKVFGYDTIVISKAFQSRIDEEDLEFLNDVWDTYGMKSGNSLEALTHREEPWLEGRVGCNENENGSTVIKPETMKKYYKSIYIGK